LGNPADLQRKTRSRACQLLSARSFISSMFKPMLGIEEATFLITLIVQLFIRQPV